MFVQSKFQALFKVLKEQNNLLTTLKIPQSDFLLKKMPS